MGAVPLELSKLLKVTDILINHLKQHALPESRCSSQSLMKHHDKKTYEGIEVWLYILLISARDWKERDLLLACPSNFISNE